MKKMTFYEVCYICVSNEPIFPILCFAFFVKNSKIEYDPQFCGGEIFFGKLEIIVSLDTLRVENFDEIALSCQNRSISHG